MFSGMNQILIGLFAFVPQRLQDQREYFGDNGNIVSEIRGHKQKLFVISFVTETSVRM